MVVNILDRQRHNEAQFRNQVATIGWDHHFNLVRLLGYFSKNIANSLVYEYMVNGSLEKFIFTKNNKEQVLSWDKLDSISLGVARGISYLHQYCENWTTHFDIKPQHISRHQLHTKCF